MKEGYKVVKEGKHCRLRPIADTDAEVTFHWRKLERAALLNKGAQTVDQQKAWIASRPENEINFMIELLDGTPVGMLSLISIDPVGKKAESARFLIGEEDKVKGKPVAVESMALLYEYAFFDLELVRIYGYVSEKNTLMVKWQKYLGMKQEGVLRHHYFIDNEFHNAIVLGILVDEYETVAKPRMKFLMG